MTSILLLAAEGSADEHDQGYPLCLSESAGKPVIQHLIERCRMIDDARLIVAMQDGDCRRWHLDNVVHQLDPSAVMLRIVNPTAGAACTSLLAISLIDLDQPLLIVNGNEIVDIDYREPIARFVAGGYDGGAVIFPSVHPRYSYVRLNDDGDIIETAEKNPISQHATVGYYWFRTGQMFIDAAERSILKGASLNGIFYICPTMNEMILKRAKLGVYPIDAKQFHPVKSERQAERLEAKLTTGGLP